MNHQNFTIIGSPKLSLELEEGCGIVYTPSFNSLAVIIEFSRFFFCFSYSRYIPFFKSSRHQPQKILSGKDYPKLLKLKLKIGDINLYHWAQFKYFFQKNCVVCVFLAKWLVRTSLGNIQYINDYLYVSFDDDCFAIIVSLLRIHTLLYKQPVNHSFYLVLTILDHTYVLSGNTLSPCPFFWLLGKNYAC